MASLIPGTVNARDIGGLPLAGGGVTASGILYRSDALFAVTDDGLAAIAESPVGTIVDFRTPQERADAPDRLPTARLFRVIEESILEGALTGAATAPTAVAGMDEEALKALLSKIPSLAGLYLGMLTHGAVAFADVARAIVHPEDPAHPAVLIHCTAGKDRTGVAAALILDAVGVERSAIVADYVSSEANLAGEWADRMLEKARSWGVPLVPAIVDLVVSTPASAIETALAWVDEQGGSAAYLQAGGLSADDLGALRTLLRA
jgi:protein-tyrosine phosphatase